MPPTLANKAIEYINKYEGWNLWFRSKNGVLYAYTGRSGQTGVYIARSTCGERRSSSNWKTKKKVESPQAGSNYRPFAYEASALPLSYRGYTFELHQRTSLLLPRSLLQPCTAKQHTPTNSTNRRHNILVIQSRHRIRISPVCAFWCQTFRHLDPLLTSHSVTKWREGTGATSMVCVAWQCVYVMFSMDSDGLMPCMCLNLQYGGIAQW